MTLLEHALSYAELGLRIFPLEPGTKKPIVSKWPTAATVDADQIREWWTRTPDAGIGLAAGDELAAGRFLFVLDLDQHDGGADGVEAWNELEAANGDVEAPEVLTPTGGSHLYMTSPKPLTNARGTLPAGIDVRGRGGFVILPPSVHPNGSTYEHELESTLGETRIPDAPDWLLAILDPPEPETPTSTKRPSDDFYADLDDRPGTEWAERTPWSELLTADGWQYAGRGGSGEEQWTRPGKDPKDGPSATVDYGGADRLVVHSTNAPIPVDSYSKLGYLATARFGGDFSTAARSTRTETTTSSTKPETVFEKTVGEWERPDPISAEQDPPPFPTNIFPAWIRDQVEQVAEELQVAEDLPATLALGALSIVAAGRTNVRIRGPWVEPTNLYLVVALPPGAGKSPAFKRMIEAPLGTWERELDESGVKDRELAKYLRKAAEKSLDKAVNGGTEEEIRNAYVELSSHEEKPTPKLFVDDATVEKLVVVMKEQGGRVALVSTEGGVFGMMTGRYSDVGFLDPYLQAWSGDTIRVDRLNRDDVVVRNPSLSIAVTVQPTVIAELAKKPELRGRGLTARFMFSYPPDNVGTRNVGRDSTFDPDVDELFAAKVVGLGKILDDYADNPIELRLDPEAAALFTRWREGHESELGAFRRLEHMREWIVKAQSSVVRLSALLHLADGNGLREPISFSTMARALTVGDYWEAHARRVHDLFDADEELVNARRLLDLIHAKVEPGGSFTVSESTQWSRSGPFRTVDGVLAPLSLLVEKGWIRADFDGPIVTGRGKASPPFTVNPLGLSRSIRSIPTAVSGQPSPTVAEFRPIDRIDIEEGSKPLSLYEDAYKDPDGDNAPDPGLSGLTPEGEPRPCPL